MQIQTVGAVGTTSGNSPASYINAFNERIFRVARNSNTKTATITAASFVRGGPAVLCTSTASVNGYDIQQPDTMGQNTNNLLIGVVYDYPDTSQARNGVWQPEDAGLVQSYGLHTGAIVSIGTVSMAPGLLLTPDTGSQFRTMQNIVAGTATVASSAIFTQLSGVGGLVILASAVASSSGSGTVAAAAFVRCM